MVYVLGENTGEHWGRGGYNSIDIYISSQELEEQNEILYNTKVVLEKQVDTLNPKADKLGKEYILINKKVFYYRRIKKGRQS